MNSTNDSEPTLEQLREISLNAAKAGALVLMEMRDSARGRQKGPRDFVSEADFGSQEAIKKEIHQAFPRHQFIGEEDPDAGAKCLAANSDDETYFWIVDPLDGTANYLHRLQGFAVSIAVARRGRVLAGVVYDPLTGESFTAALGQGAEVNGRPMKTSGQTRSSDAFVGVSLAPDVPRGSPEVARFVEAVYTCQGVRRLGSAALNLSYVADGRLDSYWAVVIKPWDVAAGTLLVTEAGGTVTRIDGSPFELYRPELIASATLELGEDLRRMFATAKAV